MRAYFLVLEAINGKNENGHALANESNKVSLAIAKKEIEMLFLSHSKIKGIINVEINM